MLDKDPLNIIETTTIHPVDTCVTTVIAEPAQKNTNQPGPWAPILIPTISSIIVFIIGWFLTRFFKRKDEIKARNKYRKMIIDWIELIEPIETKVIESTKNLSSILDISDNMQPEPFDMQQPAPNRLNELSLEKITDAFLLNKKNDLKEDNKHVFNIISGFEFLSKVSEIIQTTYEKYNEQALNLCQEWNDTYMKFFNEVKVSIHYKDYQPILKDWHAELLQHSDSTKIHQKYVNILYEKANVFADNALTPYINHMQIIILQSQKNNKGYSKNFSNMAEDLSISLKSIINASNHFKYNKLTYKHI